MIASALDLVNRNGAELCHAVYCRKHKNLVEGFNGVFCSYHLNKLSELRNNLTKFKRNGNIVEEMTLRRKEIEFRKIPDISHVRYLKTLEDRYVNNLNLYGGDENLYCKEYKLY